MCDNGDVRLNNEVDYDDSDNNQLSRGAVEACDSGAWWAVCNDHWDHEDASVVCAQLRLSPHGTYNTHEYAQNLVVRLLLCVLFFMRDILLY